MTKKIFKSNFEMKSLNLNHRILRVALLVLLTTLGITNAWAGGGTTTYYTKATVAVKTGNGTVYVGTSTTYSANTTTTTAAAATNNTTTQNAEQAYYISAVPETDYRFDKWEFSNWSTNPSTTTATTSGKVKAASNKSGSPSTGTAQATFVQISIASVNLPSVALTPTDARTSCSDYTGSVVFTTTNDNAASQIGAPTFTNTGSGTWNATKNWAAGKSTVTYTFKGNGYYGGSGTNSGSRLNSATLTLPTAGGTSSKSVTFTANFPSLVLSDAAENNKAYPINPTTDGTGTVVFPVQYCDGAFDFTATITGASGGTFTLGTISFTQTDAATGSGNITVPFTFNAGGAEGDFSATLTLTPQANTGGTAKSVTITAYAEAEATNDVSVTTAAGVTTEYATWAEGLTAANANEGSTIKLMRNVSDVNTLQTITKSVTIDLNGKTISGTGATQKISSTTYYTLFYCGTAGKTITIKDSKTGGKIKAIRDLNARLHTFVSYNGNHIVLQSGTVESENTGIYNSSSKKNVGTCPIYVKTKSTFTQDGGVVSSIAGRNAYGVIGEADATTHSTITLNAGEIKVSTPVGAYGVVSTGEINIHEGAIVNVRTESVNGVAGGATAYGIQINASANATDASSYYGTLNMDGGTIRVFTTTTTCYGILVQGVTAAATSATDGTHSNKATPHCNITGGSIDVYSTSTTAQGIQVIGDTNTKTGEHVVAQIKNCNITVSGEHPSGGNEKANIYGVYVHAVNDSARLGLRQGDVELTNCNVTATARKGQTAVAVYVHAVQFCKLADPYQGEEVATAGKVTINSGTYTAETTVGRYAYAVQSAARVKSILGIEAYPEIIIHGGTFTTTTGTTNSYAVNAGGNTMIDGGTFNATSGSTTAIGIYHLAGKLTVSGVKIASHATTNTAYGIYLTGAIHDYTGYAYASDAELNNIDATVTTGSGSTAYGVWLNAIMKSETQARYDAYMAGTAHAVTKSHYDQVWSLGGHAIAPKVTINGGTYKVTSATSTAYGAWSKKTAHPAELDVEASPEMIIRNATFDITSTTSTAGGVRGGGPVTVDNCDITVKATTETAYGVLMDDKKAVVSNSTINVTTPTKAYGLYAYSPICTKVEDCWGALGIEFVGKIESNNNTVTAKATGGNTAYGIYVHAAKAATASGPLAGDHAIAGEATINSGKYTATASGTTAYAACVADPVLQGEATATPTLIINDGKFKGTATSTYADVSVNGEPGYFVLNGGYYVLDENLDKKLGEGMNKVAVKSGTPEYTEGYRWRVTDNMTGEYVCKIKENGTSYASLEEALQVVNADPNSTWTIIMIANYTLSKGDYVLPANTTLLIPYQSGQTAINGATPKYTSPAANVEKYEAPTPLYKLTFANGVNMSVYGKIEASAVTYLSNQGLTSHGTGVVSGKYGWLYLNEGSHIDLENGSALYAWGYVTGKGEINAKNGSVVYEDFQMGDWKGGTIESNFLDNKTGLDKKGVFVITHYYYQNIECPITYRAGAQGMAHGGTYMYKELPWPLSTVDDKVPTKEAVKMIGTSGAMFLMDPATAGEDTWVRKEYNPETDYVNWTMNSGAQLGSVSIHMDLPMLGAFDVNSADYVLPITSNFNIVANYGEIDITNHVCFLPGSKLTIKKEGIVNIPSGQRVFFYDQDDWKSYGGYWCNPYYSPSWKVNPRVATIGDKTKVKMPDAEILVEGLLNINGAIYTTAGGANIHSTRENAGKVKFGAALPASTSAIATSVDNKGNTTTLFQITSAPDNYPSFEGKALNSAWLKNEDGTYSKPTSSNTSAGDTWVYMQSLTEDTYEWTKAYEDGCFTIRSTGDTKTYVHPSDWVAVGSVNANHAYPSEDGTRMFVNTEAASTSASCKWWDVNPTPEVIDGTTYYVANNENFDNFGTYYYWDNTTLYWKPKKITVTWQNEDGTKITNGTYGDLYDFNTSPKFQGENPKKTSTAIEKYDWIGWRDAEGNIYDKNATLPRATSNVTYTAYFNATKYQYTITFKNDDNSDLWAGLVDAGTTGAELQALFETKYNEKTGNTVPQKAPTVDKVFTFTGWNTALATVTAAATYTANYGSTTRQYHVTFYNYDAVSVLYEADVDYNTNPTYGGVTPFRANTSAFSYNWTGWQQGATTYTTSATLPVVKGDISYIATFEQIELKYQVFFKRQDGSIIDAPFFSYEETPAAFPANPTMASTVSTDYTFREWSPATLVPVTEDGKVYTALFDESPRQYTAHFVNFNGVSLNADQTIDYNTVPAYTGVTPMKPNDSRNSYVFSGWAWTAGEGWEAGSVGLGEALPAIKGEITFTAQYTPTLLQFDVIYQREDGFVILRDKKKWGESTTFPTTFTGATSGLNYDDETYSYTFDHWSPATVVNPVTTDATYTAYYNRSVKTYSFSSIAATPAGYGTVSQASLASIPGGSTVTVNGNKITVNGTTITATPAATTAQYTYTFSHWNNVPATVTDDVADIEAVFTRTVNQYDVTFDMKGHGSAISKQTKDYGSKVDKPADPSEAGYTFGGWYKESTCTNAWNFTSDEVTGTTLLYAKWTVNQYTITFDSDGGSAVASITQDYGTTVTPPANPTKEGYTFNGWDPAVPTTMPVGGAACVAHWTLNSYQINFVDADGTTNLGDYPKSINHGEAVTAPAEPTKTATATDVYTFAGWSNGVNTYASADIPVATAAVTYTATYTSVAPVASVTVSGETTYYATLQAAFDYAQSKASPNITVLRDINLSTDNAVYTNSKKSSVVVFELNGHKVSGACTQMLYITGTQAFTFKIQDSSVEQTGQIYDRLSSNKARCCVYAYYGTVELLSGTIYMENYNTGTSVQAYGVQVRNGANYKFNMKGGKIEVHSTRQAIGIYTGGTTTVSDGKIIVKETQRGYAAGVHVVYGTATISDDADIDVSGTTNVKGVIAGGLQPAVNSKKTAVSQYNGTAKITGGRFTVTASANTAYGVYAYKNTFALDYATNQTCPGNYVSAGTANISGGEFTVTSTGATAYGVCVQASESIKTAKDADGNATYAEKTATPKANITGGKFNVSGTSSVGAVNTDATNTALVVEGGWYNNVTNLATKYTAPTKDCNYHVLPLTGEDPYKYEVAEAYTITFLDGDGNTLQSTAVKKETTPAYSGEEPTKATDAQYTYTFTGWSPALATVTEAATYTATFTQTVNKYAITWVDGNGATLKTEKLEYGATPSYTGATPTKAEDASYTYSFTGWSPEIVAVTGEATYTAQFNSTPKTDIGPKLDIVDWTTSNLKINATAFPSAGWPYVINDVTYDKTDRADDRTLLIPYSGSADGNLSIEVRKKTVTGDIYSRHTYKIPYVYSEEEASLSDDTDESSVVYVNSGSLHIDAATEVDAIYVGSQAELVVNSPLTVNTLVLRTKEFEAASLEKNSTVTIKGHAYYTRIVSDMAYHQFALPRGVSSTDDVFLSNHAACPYGTTWLLKSYDESSRAKNGTGANVQNWKELKDKDPITASVGYELYSGSAYYREFYFPVEIPGETADKVAVSCTKPDDKTTEWYTANSGWNALCSPLLGKYVQDFGDYPEEGLKVSELTSDGHYWQHPSTVIYPAVPFYYQAPETGYLDFSGDKMTILKAPRRAWNAYVPTQWMQLAIRNIKGDKLDETSIYAHPEKFAPEYETGYDVAKQSLTGGKALIYSELPCGKLAFVAVPDSLAEQRIPLTIYAATQEEYVFSLAENNYLGRLQHVLLHDTQNGLVIDLLERDYATEINAGTNAGRFYIQCVFAAEAPAVTTGVNSVESNDDAPQKIMYKNKVYIIYQGRVYDMTGRQCELK